MNKRGVDTEVLALILGIVALAIAILLYVFFANGGNDLLNGLWGLKPSIS